MNTDWQEIARGRRNAVQIPKYWKIHVDEEVINGGSKISVLNYPSKYLTASELRITCVDTPFLIDSLQSGAWTSAEVTLAFCKRAAIAHQLTNCLTDFLYREAIEQAEKLDEHFERTGCLVGPFHGIPMSLKDVFEVKGHDCTWGLVSNLGHICSCDGEIVQLFKDLGAVIIAKTNIAQGLLLVESDNNVFGKVLNPNNLSLTAGGSSGGESALVAMRGSLMGIGTDGGGSIRLPAASTGVYGFYPTPGRVIANGISTKMSDRGGSKWIQLGIGPMAKDMQTIALYAETMMGFRKNWEHAPSCHSIDQGESEVLKIGFLYDDGIIEFTPPMVRILGAVECALRKFSGCETVRLKLGPLHRKAVETVFGIYISSGCRSYKESLSLSGEPAISRVCGSAHCPELDPNDIDRLEIDAKSICDEYLAIFESHGLHALITPACANPPAPHGQYSSNCLSAVYNLLGYPVGIIPIDKVDPELDQPQSVYTNSSCFPDIDVPNYTYDKYDGYVKQELYTNTEKFHNAPLAIQLTVPKYQDECLITIMKIVDKAVHGC